MREDPSPFGMEVNLAPDPADDIARSEDLAMAEAADPGLAVIEQMAKASGQTVEEVSMSLLMAEQAKEGRAAMVTVDNILRTLPFEARTSVLLNLLVTYVGSQPHLMKRRGKTVNAITEEVRNRLQKYLPLDVG